MFEECVRRIFEQNAVNDGWHITSDTGREDEPAMIRMTDTVDVSNYLIGQNNLSPESLQLLMDSLRLREQEFAAAALVPTTHYGRGGRGRRAPQIYHDAEPEDL